MNRKTFYYRQKVTDSELNGAFTDVEDALWALVVDMLIAGVFSGQAVTAAAVPDLTVNVSAGVAYTPQGRRMLLQAPQSVDLSLDFSGASTAVVGGGNQRILSLFMRPTRVNTDPRPDGNGNAVFFENDESIGFYVVAGAEATAGNAVAPALQPDKILLADITRSSGVSTISGGNISTARRQASTLPSTVLARYTAHISGAADRHPATQVDYAGSPAFADSSTIAAATVEAAMDALVTALAGTAGSAKLGAVAFSPGNSVFSLTTGTVQSQLRAIAQVLDRPEVLPVTSVTTSLALAANDGKAQLKVSAGGNLTITLPPPGTANGRRIHIKDALGTFHLYTITVARNAAELIEGVAANRQLFAQWGSYVFWSDGTNWFMEN